MKQLKLDHVERLNHDKRSGVNIGSRSVAIIYDLMKEKHISAR